MFLFNLNALKRQALMFDRIAVPFFSAISEEFNGERSRPRLITEVEWLIGEGIAFEPELDFDVQELVANDEFRSFVAANLSESEHIQAELHKRIDISRIAEDVGKETATKILSLVKTG